MPTYKEDVHLGHKPVLFDTDDLNDGCITERKIHNSAVTLRTLAQEVFDYIASSISDAIAAYKRLVDADLNQLHADDQAIVAHHNEDMNAVSERMDYLQQLVESQHDHGIAVANEFGSNNKIGVSQKTLTDAINKIWQKIEDMTGEVIQGINMVVNPTYFISEDGCDIHISANTVETNGIFEKIQFFVDGEVIYEEENTEYVSFDHHLESKPAPDYDYVVMCKAKIMGIEYTRQQIVTRYNEFYIGAGAAYTDIMNVGHSKQLDGTMRHDYNVTFEEGQKLIIVMGASLRPGFIRADLNGAEIEMTEVLVTIDNKDYVVLTSEPWSAGNYNIDING